ncbi:uncharacterized protein LOC114275763 [Camellia sinensis]|nr:uncharacterized protein LOC114275763 [Camellia sinensis]
MDISGGERERGMKQFSHFSHRHLLNFTEVEEEDEIICSGCELNLSGSAAYSCTKSNCSFTIHTSCFELPQRIRHRSHPKHPLILLSSPPYSDGEFTCDACGESGVAFTYHCSTCSFDLHVGCASLPESEDCDDHEHSLTLFYSFPKEEQDSIFICDVCHCPVAKNCWIYYCKVCNYGTHLDCVTAQECPDEE